MKVRLNQETSCDEVNGRVDYSINDSKMSDIE